MVLATAYSPLIHQMGIEAVLDDLRATSAQRDQERRHPFEAVAALKRAGLGVLRLSLEEGGRGIGLSELFDVVFDLAGADTSVAQALRNHLSLIEQAVRHGPKSAIHHRVVPIAQAHKTFGISLGETAGDAARFGIHRGQIDRQSPHLRETGQGLRLHGRTLYSTGNIYADHIFVTASDDSGSALTLTVPVDRDGVAILDDWDGFGQRTSGSGTTVFTNVVVNPPDIVERLPDPMPPRLPYNSSFTQLYLTTVVAGAAAAALAEARQLVAARNSNFYHGQHDRPADEAEIQALIGTLSADLFAIRSAIRAAAAAQHLAWLTDASAAGRSEKDRARYNASLDTIKAKIFVDHAAQSLTSRIFDALGGSSARAGGALDRHWRNARTVASHNPQLYKARLLGHFELNDVPTPSGLFF